MGRKMPSTCPSCGSGLTVSRLSCTRCGIAIEGSFETDEFARLSPEQRSFCLLFIRCRGSLKDVGAQLGISYPTARNRLDDLVAAMGFGEQPRGDFRMEVLEALEQGRITADEALEKLKGDEER